MRQEEIVNEIRKMCGHVEMLPSMGWHFMYHERHFIYIVGRNKGMVRICIPHLVKANEYDAEILSDAINETNRNVKFVKAVKLDCGSVALNYDYKTSPMESVEMTIPHIINVLDQASSYLLIKLERL